MASYGPNEADVRTIIERGRRLTIAEAESFLNYTDWSMAPEYRAAFNAVQQASLAHNRGHWYRAAYDAFQQAIAMSSGGRALGQSSPVALITETVTATVVRDVLAPVYFEYLMRPWHEVVELGQIRPRPPGRYIDFSAPSSAAGGCLVSLLFGLATVGLLRW